MVNNFVEFLNNNNQNPALISICDHHSEILTSAKVIIPDSCHLLNIGEDKDLCALCHGKEGGSDHVRSVIELENTMLPDNLKGNDSSGTQVNRKDKLKELLKKQDLNHLAKDQRKALKRKIMCHDKLFVLGTQELGKIKIPPVKLELDNMKPVRAPAFRHPERAKEIILNLVEDMSSKDVIEPSTASWLSPVVLV
ncbi:unnamed protein product, partial [Meganyctiphanes norvegica]